VLLIKKFDALKTGFFLLRYLMVIGEFLLVIEISGL